MTRRFASNSNSKASRPRREEDAADQVAADTDLQLGKAEARRLITGTVYAYMLEVQDTDAPTMEEFADEHSTSEQRSFNLIEACCPKKLRAC